MIRNSAVVSILRYSMLPLDGLFQIIYEVTDVEVVVVLPSGISFF